MNHRKFIAELLMLSDEALGELKREGLVKNREIAKGYSKGADIEAINCHNKYVTVPEPMFNLKPHEYRIKPRTININGYEVPEPVRNPKHEDRIFYYDGLNAKPIYRGYDEIRISHIHLRDRGVLFASEEDCQAYIDAILSFTKEKS